MIPGDFLDIRILETGKLAQILDILATNISLDAIGPKNVLAIHGG